MVQTSALLCTVCVPSSCQERQSTPLLQNKATIIIGDCCSSRANTKTLSENGKTKKDQLVSRCFRVCHAGLDSALLHVHLHTTYLPIWASRACMLHEITPPVKKTTDQTDQTSIALQLAIL